jgi:hypothetical protein
VGLTVVEGLNAQPVGRDRLVDVARYRAQRPCDIDSQARVQRGCHELDEKSSRRGPHDLNDLLQGGDSLGDVLL